MKESSSASAQGVSMSGTDNNQMAPIISINFDQFVIGLIAMFIVSFLCLILIFAVAPLLLIPAIHISFVLHLFDTSKIKEPAGDGWQFFSILSLLFMLAAYVPVRVSWWGASSFLERRLKPSIQFTVIWFAWYLLWWGLLRTAFWADYVLIAICLGYVFLRQKNIFK